MDLLWLAGMMVFALAVLWTQRKKAARREVDRLVERGGLPPEPELVASALSWQQRRQEVLVLGTLVGALAGGAVLLLADLGLDLNLVPDDGLDIRLLSWMFVVAAAAGGVATLLHGYRTVRASRSDGPRTATLRPRRLSDYLSPVEIAVHYGVVVVPLIAVGLGIIVLGSADRPERGWILIVSGLAGVVLWGAGLVLQRMALRVNQASGGQAELHWQEALRAATLRDLGGAVITVSWLLGASMPLSFDWPRDAPGFVEPLSLALFVASLGLIGLVSLVSVSRRGLRRVQRVAG